MWKLKTRDDYKKSEFTIDDFVYDLLGEILDGEISVIDWKSSKTGPFEIDGTEYSLNLSVTYSPLEKAASKIDSGKMTRIYKKPLPAEELDLDVKIKTRHSVRYEYTVEASETLPI